MYIILIIVYICFISKKNVFVLKCIWIHLTVIWDYHVLWCLLHRKPRSSGVFRELIRSRSAANFLLTLSIHWLWYPVVNGAGSTAAATDELNWSTVTATGELHEFPPFMATSTEPKLLTAVDDFQFSGTTFINSPVSAFEFFS